MNEPGKPELVILSAEEMRNLSHQEAKAAVDKAFEALEQMGEDNSIQPTDLIALLMMREEYLRKFLSVVDKLEISESDKTELSATARNSLTHSETRIRELKEFLKKNIQNN